MSTKDGKDDEEMQDSEDDALDVSEEQMALLMKAEEELAANPANYDGHIQYIELLKTCKLQQRLRSARCQFAKQFPLSPTLWSEWLNDELERAERTEDITFLLDKFSEAVKDYASVELWQQYLEVVQGFDSEVSENSPAGQAKMLQLFEDALAACGLHVTAGSVLYAQLRGYLQRLADEARNDGADEAAAAAALDKVREAWFRQLKTPLSDGPETLSAYKEWEAALPESLQSTLPPRVEKAYSSAQAAVAVRSAFEAAVADDVAADESLLKSFLSYIQFEQGGNNAARRTLLFERAIARFPVTASLWEQLTEHLESTSKDPTAILETYGRAVRNCPWAGSLWSAWLRALERLAEEKWLEGGRLSSGQLWQEEHEAVYMRALQAGLKGEEDYMQVLLARLDMMRRTAPGVPLTEAFSAATQLMAAYFPKYVDPEFRLPQYWAHCEVRVNSDMDAARQVWRTALQGELGKLWRAHQTYIYLEAAFGTAEQVRRHLESIASRKFAEPLGPVQYARTWLRFEREHGSAAELFRARKKCGRVIAEAEAAQAAAPGKTAKSKPKQAKMQLATEGPTAKQGHGKARPGLGFTKPPPSKRAKVDAHGSNPPTQPSSANAGQDAAAAPEAAAMDDIQPAAGGPSAQEDSGTAHASERKPKHDSALTLFIKHLPMDVTEEDVRGEVLGGVPGVKNVRLATDTRGVGRGFAYVDMEDDAGMQEALKRNDLSFRGKYLFIAASKPPRGNVGGRGGGFGAGRGTRGRGERGRGGGRGTGARGGSEHMRRRFEFSEEHADEPAAAPPTMMPRAVMKSTPKSNEEFRKLLG